jgi:hypothetical protein
MASMWTKKARTQDKSAALTYLPSVSRSKIVAANQICTAMNAAKNAYAATIIYAALAVAARPYFTGAVSLAGVPSTLLGSPCLLASFKSWWITPARRSCSIRVYCAFFCSAKNL